MSHRQNTLQKSALYVVATPIGNLRDISLRALEVLSGVDVVAAEDTRTSGHLLAHHGIHTKLLAVHQHNERGAATKIIGLLAEGKSVALVTDAGTPGISDPGAVVVQGVREQGYKVIPIPGANAAICALSAAGVAAPHFLFYGFLPAKSAARQRELTSLKTLAATLVFYEAPHRIIECVTDLHAVLGSERQITVARELTKLFEAIYTCPLGDALAWLQADANRQKGEFVLLLSGAETPPSNAISDPAQHALKSLLAELPLKQAVKLAAEISGENKNALYDLALSLKKQ